jgi:hypothetical protein
MFEKENNCRASDFAGITNKIFKQHRVAASKKPGNESGMEWYRYDKWQRLLRLQAPDIPGWQAQQSRHSYGMRMASRYRSCPYLVCCPVCGRYAPCQNSRRRSRQKGNMARL